MNAKDYLKQLKKLDVMIQDMEEQLEFLHEQASSAGAIRYDKEKIQMTQVSSKLEELVLSYIELENEIKKERLTFQLKKQKIIHEIHEIDDIEGKYISVLYKRYVEYKSYELIAVEMNYSFDYVKELHRDALERFHRKHPTLSHL